MKNCVLLQLNFKIMKKYILATRPWSLPASIMPALVTISFVFLNRTSLTQSIEIDWIAAVLALIGAAIFHLSGNLISDYFDFKHGVDSHENIGQTNLTIVDGIIPAKTILRLGIILMTIGSLIGIYLVVRCGLPVLYIGIAGTLLTIFYFFLKANSLGDLCILVNFGILIPLGTYFCATSVFFLPILYVTIPTGLLVVCILHANNMRDRALDTRSGITSFAKIIGTKGSKIYYVAMVVAAYLIVIVNIILKNLPLLALIVLLSCPIAWANVKKMVKCEEMTEIAALDGETAKLVMIFSLLVSIANFVAPLF